MATFCVQGIAVLFLTASFLFVSILTRQSRFKVISLTDEQICPVDDVLFVKEDVSAITCSSMCSDISICIGAVYTQSNKLCVGCKLPFNTTDELEIFVYRSLYEQSEARVDLDVQFLYECGEINGWEIFDGSYYKYYQHLDMAFESAQKFCRTQCSNMVHIDSMEEAQYIRGIARENEVQGLYIGLKHDTENGDWRWTDDNQPLTISNWAVGEPNGSGNEHCVALYPPFYHWVDINCFVREFSFVCEKKELD